MTPTRIAALVVMAFVSSIPFSCSSAAVELSEPASVSGNGWANLNAPQPDEHLFLQPIMPPTYFVRVVSSDIHQLCAPLAALEGANTPERIASAEGQACSWLKPIAGGAGEISARSIFFMAVAQNGSARSVRFKLNSTIQNLAADIAQLTGSVARLHQLKRWTMPPNLADALSTGTQLELEHGGIKYTWSKEFGEIPRFNLQLIFNESKSPLLQRSDRFQPRTP